jgi:hypothetical protein
MRRGCAPIAAAAVVLCCVLLIDQAGPSAEQSALPKVGLTTTDIQTWVTTSALGSDGSSVSWETPTLSGAAMAGIAAMTAAERVALVREVLGVVKTAAAAPAFQAAFAALLKQKLNAVNHGINTNTYGMEDPQKGMIMMVVLQMRLMFDGQPPAALLEILENDKAELAELIRNETGETRAKAQKDLARLSALAPLTGKPDEFKTAYILAKSASIGGPDTEAGMKAAVATGAEQDRMRREQRAWDGHNINVHVRSQLEANIKELSGYNLSIPTRVEGGYVVAADPLQLVPEGPTPQLAYRLGRAPTDAAVQFMRTWLKELGK